MRNLCTMLVAASLAAAPMASAQSLAPGKPAGVRPAQDFNMGSNTALILLGAAAIVGIAVAVASSNNSNGGTPSGGNSNNTVITPATTI